MKAMIYTLKAFLLMLLFFSCEDMIEVDAPQNQIDKKIMFDNLQTTDAALADVYANLWDNSIISGGINGSGALLGTYTDDLDCYSISINNGAYDLYLNQPSGLNTSVLTVWTNAYRQIYATNAIIEGVTNSTKLAESDKKRVIGEALAIRSLLYTYLYQLFGEIPYITSTDYEVNKNMKKSSIEEVQNQIIADLKTSILYLKDDYRHIERIYINKKTVELILAKVLIAKKDWEGAEALLQSIIQSPLYFYQNDIDQVFNKNSRHILWQLKPKNTNDATKEVLLYSFENSAPGNYALSQNLVLHFLPSDLRKQKWMATTTFNQNTYYRNHKYKNKTNNTTEYSIVFRMEEVYLLLAEVLIQQDKLSDALPFLNASRSRANIPIIYVLSNKQEGLNEVMNENRREFFSEMGHRFFDLKRSNQSNQLINGKPNWKTYNEKWPIPQNEILLNPNLLPQNSNY